MLIIVVVDTNVIFFCIILQLPEAIFSVYLSSVQFSLLLSSMLQGEMTKQCVTQCAIYFRCKSVVLLGTILWYKCSDNYSGNILL